MEQKYVLFGAGVTGMAAVNYFIKEQIEAVIDNCAAKIGTLFEDIPIISFSEYLERYSERQIIISICSKNYFSVKNQLEEGGIFDYFTAPPVLYGYDVPEEMAKTLLQTKPGRVIFYGINPISSRMYEWLKKNVGGEYVFVRTLKEKTESTYEKMYPKIMLNEITEDDTVVLTTNEQEEHIRKNIQVFPTKKIYDIYEKNICLHKELEVYKDKHKGERCFIIGNGPSLTVEDLEKLRTNKEITFGSNRIYLIYKDTLWRPTYYVAIDALGIQHSDIGMAQCLNETAFVADFYYINLPHMEGINRFSMLNKIYDADEDIYFSDDITKGIASGRTVTYAMIQLACFMGFSDIYLLGVDFSWGEGGQDTHFCKNYSNEREDKLQRTQAILDKEEISLAYTVAKKYAAQRHIHIYNATRGGYLEVFDRINFDSLFT